MARRTVVKLTPLRRHLAAVITIALSCAFVAVMVLAGNLMQASLRSQAAQQFDGADLEVERPLSDEERSAEQPLAAPAVDGAEEIWPQVNSFVELSGEDAGSRFFSVAMLPPGEAGTEQLHEGELPTSESEVVLDQATADALQISLGDTVTVPASFSASGQELPLSVVGIAEPPEGAGFGGSSRVQIGRASCRERGEGAGGAGLEHRRDEQTVA